MSKKGTTQKKYQITSSPYEKIKSPFQNTQKKRSYPKEFIYFNRNQKMRNLVITNPTTLADVESTIEAEDALDIYQQVMAEAAKCIQSCFRNSRYFTEVRKPPVVENNTISLDLSKSSNKNPETTYEQAQSETDKQLSSNNEVESPHEDSDESQHEENQYDTENENIKEEENVDEDQIEENYEEDHNEEEDEAQFNDEESIPNSNNENASEEENQSNVNPSSGVETSGKNEEETEANEMSNNFDQNSNHEEETQAEVDDEN